MVQRALSAAGLGFGLALVSGCSQSNADAPPPPPQEIIVASPGPDYVWVAGYWGPGWGWNHYSWVAGHWDRGPRVNAVWVGPRWESRGDVHVFVKGYWR
jgi:hypothetical protein